MQMTMPPFVSARGQLSIRHNPATRVTCPMKLCMEHGLYTGELHLLEDLNVGAETQLMEMFQKSQELADRANGQLSPDQSAEEGRNPDITAEKELIEAMEELLGRFQDNLPSTEKRAIPKCLVGSRCAMRLGPRWGPLCECSRGTYCNSILLKCI
uniref:Cocaine- and amphetamine-regulated transcript-like n=1 Tax=Astyanax mexicanus TaxID=7994 RepID=A0A3B1IPI1_ASTMX